MVTGSNFVGVVLRAFVSCCVLAGGCPQLSVTWPSPSAAYSITSFEARRGDLVFSQENEKLAIKGRAALGYSP